MKLETLERLCKIMEWVAEGNTYIFLSIVYVIASPFLLFVPLVLLFEKVWHYIDRKRKGKFYDPTDKVWTTKEEQAQKALKEKIENREIPLVAGNHVAPQKDGKFLFFEKRKLYLQTNQLVYVETEYNEKLHRFFDDNADWIERWQYWYGLNIVKADYEDIKEGMLYPQDFSVFKHGFLWHSIFLSDDKESGIWGSEHRYHEIDPDSEIPIKEQMERFPTKIYQAIDM